MSKTKFETQYDPEPYIEKQSVAPAQEYVTQLNQMAEAINLLTKEHREVLILVCVKGIKYSNVADVLDIPVGTVRSRLSRAREQLQNMM